VIYPGSTPVGNATLVVANVLTCNKHTPNYESPAMLTMFTPDVHQELHAVRRMIPQVPAAAGVTAAALWFPGRGAGGSSSQGSKEGRRTRPKQVPGMATRFWLDPNNDDYVSAQPGALPLTCAGLHHGDHITGCAALFT
jgi:hypothetical protein